MRGALCGAGRHARVRLGAAAACRRAPGATAPLPRRIAAAAAAAVESPATTIPPALREIARAVQAGERSAVDVTEEWLARLEGAEPGVRAFITVDAAGARAAAAALDARIAAGEAVGPLAGVPIGVKDTICTKGLRTTAAAAMLADHVPAYDASAVARLRAAGAVVVGKTNCDAFAMGSTGEASAAGPTANPWAPGRVPGGSSGGSAAAVAARQVPAALGSDTGGSIRQPASFCGVVGIKPTYGRVPRHGLIAYGSSLDCIGPLAATVEDAALVLDVISGREARDATSSGSGGGQASAPTLPPLVPPGGLPSAAALGPTPLAGLRAGIIAQTVDGPGLAPGVAAAFARACDHLRALGASVTPVSLPSFGAALPAYYVIATAEASSNLARFDGLRLPRPAGAAEGGNDVRAAMAAARAAGFPAEVKRRILMGTYVLSAGYVDAYYARAQRVRTLIQREMGGALRSGVALGGGVEAPPSSSAGGASDAEEEKFDVLLAPAAPTAAYATGAGAADPLAMYLGDVMTVPLNLAGLPGVCVPAGFDDGVEGGEGASPSSAPPLPVGLQVIAGAWGEAEAVRVAHAFEVTAPWARRGWAPGAAK